MIGITVAGVLSHGLWRIHQYERVSQVQPAQRMNIPSISCAMKPRTKVPQEVGWIGVILGGESVEIEPGVGGRIDKVFVNPGDRLERGDVIAELDIRSLRQDLVMTQAATEDA